MFDPFAPCKFTSLEAIGLRLLSIALSMPPGKELTNGTRARRDRSRHDPSPWWGGHQLVGAAGSGWMCHSCLHVFARGLVAAKLILVSNSFLLLVVMPLLLVATHLFLVAYCFYLSLEQSESIYFRQDRL